MRLYLDSAVVIYHIERTTPFATAVDARLSAPGVVLVSSELARLECLVLPLRNADTAKEGDFNTSQATAAGLTVCIMRSVYAGDDAGFGGWLPILPVSP